MSEDQPVIEKQRNGIAINGKTRTELTISLDATQQQVEETILHDAVFLKWLEGKLTKKDH